MGDGDAIGIKKRRDAEFSWQFSSFFPSKMTLICCWLLLVIGLLEYVDVYIISNIGDIPWFHWEEAILIESSMVEEDDDEDVQTFTS